jgi:hypothetical protein
LPANFTSCSAWKYPTILVDQSIGWSYRKHQWLRGQLQLSAEPGWLEPDQWPKLIETTRNYGCLVVWVFMNTGDQELGEALLLQATAYIEDSLPLVNEHANRYFPDECYLVAGETEKALQSIETQLAHNHLYAGMLYT